MLGGCGVETPPYEELPLRDALSAAPEVVAAMPEGARRALSHRLEEAQAVEAQEASIDAPTVATLDTLVRTADEEREAEGKDALVLGTLGPDEAGFVLRATPLPGDEAQGPAVAPALEGKPDASTAALEDAALHGRAGALLQRMAQRSGAKAFVRTTGLPMGAVVLDGTLYVNASWLVAMSALEPKRAVLIVDPGAESPLAGTAPPRTLQSVDANPYDLPASVDACANQVRDTCTCAAKQACQEPQTDPTFASPQAECEWVDAAATNASGLCVLALMSIDALKACVQSAGSRCTKLPVKDRDAAVAFAADTNCMQVMDECLQNGRPASSSNGSSCGSCSGNGCNNSWGSCGNCGSNSGGSNSCGGCKSGSCTVAPDPEVTPLPGPVGALLWLFAPVGYLLLQARRRS